MRLSRSSHLGSLILCTALAGSCSDSTGSSSKNGDIPADPGTSAPVLAPTTGAYVPSGLSVDSPLADNPARVRLIVGGVTASGVTYTRDNLVVVEDGVVKGIKITTGSAAQLKADIAFVIDNTSSMSSGIASVRNSVLAFVNALRTSGQDVRVGVVAYNDDGGSDGNATYSVASSDVASKAAVYGFRPLTSDLTTTGTVYTFVSSLPATGGGDLPELAFSGLDFARRTFDWRTGAQRIYIVITDATSWGKSAPAGTAKGISATYPWTDVTLGTQLQSEGSVVHCVCPDARTVSTGEYNVRPLATLTGGTWTAYTASGFDLTTLPILGVTTSSALVEFVKSGDPATVRSRLLRVVVQSGASLRGERIVTISY